MCVFGNDFSEMNYVRPDEHSAATATAELYSENDAAVGFALIAVGFALQAASIVFS